MVIDLFGCLICLCGSVLPLDFSSGLLMVHLFALGFAFCGLLVFDCLVFCNCLLTFCWFCWLFALLFVTGCRACLFALDLVVVVICFCCCWFVFAFWFTIILVCCGFVC